MRPVGTGQRDRDAGQRRGPGRPADQHRHRDAEQREHADVGQLGAERQRRGQRDAQQRAGAPGERGDRVGAVEEGHALHQPRFALALQERGQRPVDGQEAGGQPQRQRHPAQMARQHRAVDHEAQVGHRRGADHRQHPGRGRHQRQHRQLRGARVDDEGQAEHRPQAQTEGGHGHAGDQAPGGDRRQARHGRARAGGKGGAAGAVAAQAQQHGRARRGRQGAQAGIGRDHGGTARPWPGSSRRQRAGRMLPHPPRRPRRRPTLPTGSTP